MSINKKFLQVIAAIWIFAFHLWITVGSSAAGQFILKIGYAGVDIFFFLAAYSFAAHAAADRHTGGSSYLKLVGSRFANVYVKFLIFVAAAALMKSWELTRFLKTALFVDFFEKGGQAFLGFVPAIMIFYLIYPLFLKIPQKRMPLAIAAVVAGWFCLSLVSQYVIGYTRVFAFTNRIPLIMVGYLLATHQADKKRLAAVLCLPIGLVLLYLFGYEIKLNLPFEGFFYVFVIPLVVGLAALSGYVGDYKALKIIGSATLEMYCIQMVFGYDLAAYIYRMTSNALATDMLTLAIITVAAVILSKIYSKITSMIKHRAA